MRILALTEKLTEEFCIIYNTIKEWGERLSTVPISRYASEGSLLRLVQVIITFLHDTLI